MLRQGSQRHRRALEVVFGVSLAVSGFYALLFLPLLPIAVVAIVFYGLGLLPLGPLTGFLTTLRLRAKLNAVQAASKGGLAFGAAAGLVALIALDVPQVATRVGLQKALSDDAGTRQTGIGLIRNFGDQDVLLRLAYDTGGRTGGPLSLMFGLGASRLFDDNGVGGITTPAQVREVFYRAYGRPFNAFPPPHTGRQWAMFDQFEFDGDLGGTDVGARVKGLSLVTSRLDGSVNGRDLVGYVEWIVEFRNTSVRDQEARMTVALPPGAVVSRATLWVNGEEREAAYGGRGEVRRAYEQVAVRQRRDPLLVTTKGADRVLAQAFPVPRGGSLKMKLGITLPLEPDDTGRARFVLPAIVDRNFDMPADMAHAVWIEAKAMLTADSEHLRGTGTAGGNFRVEGSLSDHELAVARPLFQVASPKPFTRAVAHLDGAPMIVQEIQEAPAQPDRGLLLVLDGSLRMAPHAAGVIAALDALPEDARVGLIIAAEPLLQVAQAPWTAAHRAAVKAAIAGHAFAGGEDNAPALAEALKRAGEMPNTRILWVHGPQPVRFAASGTILEQAAARLDAPVALDLLAVEPGPNDLLPDEPWAWGARMVPSHGNTTRDLTGYLMANAGGASQLIVSRTLSDKATPVSVAKGSPHIVRLWARDDVLRTMRKDSGVHRASAVKLASDLRLVTPVSGAVVLETQAQFEANGLQPAAQGSVPTVPEPHEWALMILAALALLHLWRQRARAEGAFA